MLSRYLDDDVKPASQEWVHQILADNERLVAENQRLREALEANVKDSASVHARSIAALQAIKGRAT
jgi:hypothetical protein